jgi:hypothetical protein
VGRFAVNQQDLILKQVSTQQHEQIASRDHDGLTRESHAVSNSRRGQTESTCHRGRTIPTRDSTIFVARSRV